MNIATQFLKYVTVAILSAASDWMVFAAVLAAFSSPIMAQGTSRIIGGMVSFVVNKYWSFRSRQYERTLIEAWRFLLLFIASYTLSLSLFSIVTWCGMSPYKAKLITDTACFLFNFLVMRLWVYRPQAAAPMAKEQDLTRLHQTEGENLPRPGSDLANTLSSAR